MPAKKSPEPPPKEFTVSAGMIKWLVGFLGGVVVLIGGWFVIWDRIDTHWRLEQVQSAKDKEAAAEIRRIDADVKAAREKAETDTKLLAKKAETGRAWVIWSVQDTKAYTAAQFARVCRALKLPPDECARQDGDAQLFRQDATNAKHEAADAGKEK